MTHPVAWTAEEFEARLCAKQTGYHIHHPFNLRIRAGECTPEEIRTWVTNRFYYQINIPLKDAATLFNCPGRVTCREWIIRVYDHDDDNAQPGGIESWARLDVAVGLTRDALWSHRHLLPGVRFAADVYVSFVRCAPWQEAVCSSLTEMFAPDIHKERLAGWPEHYLWVQPEGLAYFRSRIPLVSRDVEHGLRMTLDYFRTPEQQLRALDILQFKLDILWSMFDAIQQAHAHEPFLV